MPLATRVFSFQKGTPGLNTDPSYMVPPPVRILPIVCRSQLSVLRVAENA
jgi:hypothetical protein